jgi:hypothetical protein
MVVALDLEGDRLALAEVEHTGVLARPLQHSLAGGGKPAQEERRMLVAAVLRPEQREDRQLEVIRVAAEQLLDSVELPVREAEGAVQRLFGNRRQNGRVYSAVPTPPVRDSGVVQRLRSLPPAAVLAALVAVSTLLRIWGGTLVPAPWYTPDEMIYGELGRSLWTTGHLGILGHRSAFYGFVYPAFVGPWLSFGNLAHGYALLKGAQALVMSLTAVPVYLWSRRMMRPGWALAAAALTLAVPGLAFSGFVMTEVAFYPVLVLAAWALASALARPSGRTQLLVVGALALAVLTRLQSIVLVPVFLLALALAVLFERRLAPARRLWPLLAGIAVGAVLVKALGGSQLLGAYGTVGRQTYDAADAISFALYHAADVLIVLGAVPVVALVLAGLPSFAGREQSADVRAYVAVAIALFLGLTGQVGLFASQYTGRLAERNLLPLFPVVLIGFALWLDRGAPRPRVATVLVSVAAVIVVALLPPGRFVVEAAIPDTYGVVPLYRLKAHAPGLDLGLALFLGALAAVLLLEIVPRRALIVLPVAVGAYMAVASVTVTRTVAHQARAFWPFMVGEDLRWVDKRAAGPVTYLYAGDQLWNRAWYNTFWNRKIDRVYTVGTQKRILGPMPQRTIGVPASGLVRAPAPRYAVIPWYWTVAGERLGGAAGAELALWKVEPPLRVLTQTEGVLPDGGLGSEAEMRALGCHGGRLLMTLNAAGDRRVEIQRNDVPYRTIRLRGQQTWSGSIPSGPPEDGMCRFTVTVKGGIFASRFDFVRNARR